MIGLRELIQAYGDIPTGDRLHMIIRWRLAPLRRIAALVPEAGVILDLGCGHGLFTQLLARSAPQRQVIGVDLDADKIKVAQQLKFPNLEFKVGDVAAVDVPPSQAVTITDVFYLVPYEIQEKLLAICADKLAPGGVIVLKEMAEVPRWKMFLNWLEETLAVKVLRITVGKDFYFRPRAEWQKLFQLLGFTVETIPLDRGYYHPHVVFVAKKL